MSLVRWPMKQQVHRLLAANRHNEAVIAALRPGYKDQWFQRLQPGGTYTIWMKFPAPPADVKTVTLQVPGVPPFEDLAIQDS